MIELNKNELESVNGGDLVTGIMLVASLAYLADVAGEIYAGYQSARK